MIKRLIVHLRGTAIHLLNEEEVLQNFKQQFSDALQKAAESQCYLRGSLNLTKNVLVSYQDITAMEIVDYNPKLKPETFQELQMQFFKAMNKELEGHLESEKWKTDEDNYD